MLVRHCVDGDEQASHVLTELIDMTQSAHAPQADRIVGNGDVRRARALSDPSRVRVFTTLLASDGPLRVSTLAERLDLHHTVVRQHLKVLTSARLVTSEPLPVSGRGRPSVGWRAVAPIVDPYRWLSEVLAEALSAGVTPRVEGQRVGETLAQSGQGGVDAIMTEATRLGFEPRKVTRGRGRTDVVLERCPFAEVAEIDPHVVCDLHHGLAAGIASVCGDVTVERLDVRPARVAGCRLVLRAVESATARSS